MAIGAGQARMLADKHGNEPLKRHFLLAAVLSFGLVVGCSNDRKAQEIDRMLSRTAIAVDVAKSEETKRYSALELATAEEKLALARRAAHRKEYEEADQLISESLVILNLATAKAAAERIRSEIDQLKGEQTSAPDSGRP